MNEFRPVALRLEPDKRINLAPNIRVFEAFSIGRYCHYFFNVMPVNPTDGSLVFPPTVEAEHSIDSYTYPLKTFSSTTAQHFDQTDRLETIHNTIEDIALERAVPPESIGVLEVSQKDMSEFINGTGLEPASSS